MLPDVPNDTRWVTTEVHVRNKLADAASAGSCHSHLRQYRSCYLDNQRAQDAQEGLGRADVGRWKQIPRPSLARVLMSGQDETW